MIHQCPHVFWIIFLMGILVTTSSTDSPLPPWVSQLFDHVEFLPHVFQGFSLWNTKLPLVSYWTKKFQPKMPPYATYIYLIGDLWCMVLHGHYFLMFNWFDTSFASGSQALENLRFVFDSVNSTSTKWHKSRRYFTTACVLRAASVAAIFSCQNGGSHRVATVVLHNWPGTAFQLPLWPPVLHPGETNEHGIQEYPKLLNWSMWGQTDLLIPNKKSSHATNNMSELWVYVYVSSKLAVPRRSTLHTESECLQTNARFQAS